MKATFAICLGLAAVFLPGAVSAQALLAPHEIATSVRSAGLDPISRPVLRRGDRYVLRAIDGLGAEVAVAADAMSGRILFVRPVGYGREPVYAERSYPPPSYYPEEAPEPRGTYQRAPQRTLQDPAVIYAPRTNGAAPQIPTPTPAPSAAKKPVAPKVAAKPMPKPVDAAVAEKAAPEEPAADATTGASSAAPPAEKPALSVPPVQGFD